VSGGWRDPARLRRALEVYVLTDPDLTAGRPLLDVVRAALAGGAGAVQLRDKRLPARDLCALGRALAALCAEHGALFVVNDRLDVALACGAAGVHLGQDDLPAAAARALAGPDFVVGVSASTPEEALEAARAGADYLGTGAVYATATKPDAGAPIGVRGLRRVVESVPLPVVAIGGITAANAAEAVAAGAAGVAVVSAVMAAPDPGAAVAELRRAVRRGRTGGGDGH
jgi:thiamine-phosphate pyrophosphorylase